MTITFHMIMFRSYYAEASRYCAPYLDLLNALKQHLNADEARKIEIKLMQFQFEDFKGVNDFSFFKIQDIFSKTIVEIEQHKRGKKDLRKLSNDMEALSWYQAALEIQTK